MTDTLAIKPKQPSALYVLLLTEVWERFSYYGMRALFILYMVNGLVYTDERAYAIYGAYGALIYITPLLGGAIADRYLGYRRAIIFGGLLMAVGQFCLIIKSETAFFLGVGLLISGNGFLKPNISSLLGKFYKDNDGLRHSGFTLFYVGVNVGGFIAPIACGFVGAAYGWHYGFGLAGVGMLLGLITFYFGTGKLQDHGLPPAEYRSIFNKLHMAIYALVLLVLVPSIMIMVHYAWAGWLLATVGVLVAGYLLRVYQQSTKQERQHLIALCLLMMLAMFFWTFSEQIGSSINLFTYRNIDRSLFGYEIPAAVFQSLNSAFIIICGPLFAKMWTKLSQRTNEPSTMLKFSLGIVQLGLGFVLLGYISLQSIAHGGHVHMMWLVLGVFLMTTGELCVEPVGLSEVTRLAPVKIVGFMMGFWYLMDGSFSNYLAGWVASMTSLPDADSVGQINLVESARLSGTVFKQVGLVAVALGLLTLLLIPWFKRLMNGEAKQG